MYDIVEKYTTFSALCILPYFELEMKRLKKKKLMVSVQSGAESKLIGRMARKATSDAYLQALKLPIPVIIKEGNQLVEIWADGSRRVIKALPNRTHKIKHHYKLS